MESIFQTFINAKAEFISSNASERSVEKIYDVIYFLAKIEKRNFDENYLLAQAYDLVGEHIYALKIIEKNLIKTINEVEKRKLNELQNKINSQDVWKIKHYRDLRDAKIIKEPTILNINDFNISKNRNEYCIEITNKIQSFVILNKNVKNEDAWGKENNYIAFSETEPSNFLLLKLKNYIEWLGGLKYELLDFYNNQPHFEGKLRNVNQDWYDGLNIFDFWISIDKDENFETEFILYDYIQNDYGFRLEIHNKKIYSIEYDANL